VTHVPITEQGTHGSEAKAAIFTHEANIYVSYKNGEVGRRGFIAAVH
jgi:hypothetical protein